MNLNKTTEISLISSALSSIVLSKHLAIIPLSMTMLGVAGFMAEQANAITLSYTANTGFTTADLVNEPLDNPAKIAQFDAMSLMTATQNAVLNSVTINYFGAIKSSGTITSTANSSHNFSIRIDANASIDGPVNASDVLFAFPGTGGISSLNVALEAKNLASGATANFSTTSNTSSITDPGNPITLTNPADLAAFLGNGTVDFFGNTQVSQTIRGGGGNAIARLNTLVDLGVTVEYNYDLVPKPPTGIVPKPLTGTVPEPLTILGAGAAIGFGTAFKRKLARANKKG